MRKYCIFFSKFTGSSTSSTVSRQNSETPNFTDNSSRRTIQTPSPSVTFKTHIRARPKSFAQKFRPNSRLAGYSSGGLRFIYHTRAIISRGLYIFLPHFQRPFSTVTFGLMYGLYSRAASNQERPMMAHVRYFWLEVSMGQLFF